MDTETLTVLPKGEDFEIIVQHDQSGSAYGMPLSKSAYEQLRQHFVSGSLPHGLNADFCEKCFSITNHKVTCCRCGNDR